MTIHLPRIDVTFRHVISLTDDRGILEHAKGPRPRYGHGYCTDDNARLLIVAARDNGRNFATTALTRIALRFVTDSQHHDGAVKNRMSFERTWLDEPTLNDCWGRAVWALGTAAARLHDGAMREGARTAFEASAVNRTGLLRPMCFAALGAAEILAHDRWDGTARSLMRDAADLIGRPAPDSSWPWPEPRLTYANAAIAEALIAAGDSLHDRRTLDDGLDLLEWLLETETHGGHLSVTPTGGRGPGDPKPAFDQQPIEVAALADACARAHRVTGHARWRSGVQQAVAWFLGDNDTGLPMIDTETHGGFDGLEEHSVNLNQGAESTLAMLATMQLAEQQSTPTQRQGR